MKRIAVFTFLLAGLALATDGMAQKKKAKPKTTNTKNAAQVVEPPPPPVDTPKVVIEEKDTIPLRAVEVSRRPASTVQGNLVTDKTPLAYDHIRIDDQVYRQIIWREIDTREKMNQPFVYEADEDNGNQRFFNILLKHLKEGDITAFSNVNDRFTKPSTVDEIATMLAGKKYTISKPDYEKDPDGTLGILKDTTIRDEFDETSITSYRIKEEVIFDKETSRLHFRILGIAPVKTIKNDDGSYRDSYALFWVYYPELRPILAKYEAYNPKNLGMRMSWEEIFETRYFASYIYKSTLNNPFDKPLAAFISDPLMRLLEGDNIKETIFNWEQNQWSY
jgi:gliding motility associated protien GldN